MIASVVMAPQVAAQRQHELTVVLHNICCSERHVTFVLFTWQFDENGLRTPVYLDKREVTIEETKSLTYSLPKGRYGVDVKWWANVYSGTRLYIVTYGAIDVGTGDVTVHINVN